MKNFAIALGAVSLFVAGSVHAGAGCNYGQAGELAKFEKKTPVLAESEQVDPRWLAKLKEQELEQAIELPVIHN